MDERGLTPATLQRRLGLRSRATVTRYLTGDRAPAPRVLERLIALTGGLVTHEDFIDASPPRCAEVIDGPDGEPVLVFPWTPGREALTARMFAPDEADEEFLPPVRRALAALGDRVRPRPPRHSGLFTLDGRLVDTRGLVRAANAALANRGERPIAYPLVHRDEA